MAAIAFTFSVSTSSFFYTCPRGPTNCQSSPNSSHLTSELQCSFPFLPQNLCVDEKRGGEAATQPNSWIGGERAFVDGSQGSAGRGSASSSPRVRGTTGAIGRNRGSLRRGSIGSIERPRSRDTAGATGSGGGCSSGSEFGGDTSKGAMREAFPSLPFGSPVLDREISKINSNNISSNAGTAASPGTPRCHSTSPHPPSARGPVEREGATSATPAPLLGTTTSAGGSASASVATSPVPSHHHLNIIKEGVQTLERDNFLSNISSEPASTDGEWGKEHVRGRGSQSLTANIFI